MDNHLYLPNLGALFFGISLSALASATSLDFTYTGSYQTFVVPSDVSVLSISAWGGSGAGISSFSGGLGGFASGDLSVTEGETLYIYVGGQGTGAIGGWNGGGTGSFGQGGGGGGSFVELSIGGTPLLVAGGGGGAGIYGAGGAGGGVNGNNGNGSFSNNAGGGGTQTSGGVGGIYNASFSTSGSYLSGGSANLTAFPGPSGGGGAGYYGGGGGNGGAGGGGGSSFVQLSLANRALSGTLLPAGDGRITLTWTAPVPEPETYAMFIAGLALTGFVVRRKRQQTA